MVGRDDQGLIPLPDKNTFRPNRRDADPALGVFAYVRGRQQVMNFGGPEKASPARASEVTTVIIQKVTPGRQQTPIIQPEIHPKNLRKADERY